MLCSAGGEAEFTVVAFVMDASKVDDKAGGGVGPAVL